MTEDTEVREALRAYVQDPPLPDFYGGLIHRRRRRLGAQGAMALAVVAVVGVSIGAQQLAGRSGGAPMLTAAPPGPNRTTPATPAPTRDPGQPGAADFIQRLHVTWPTGYEPDQVLLRDTTETANANRTDSAEGGWVIVTLYEDGAPPQPSTAGRTPAPAVGGHPAWWWCTASPGSNWPVGSSDECTTLAWQDADGDWITAQSGDRDVARQTAAGVSVDPTPVTYPYSISGLPAAYTVLGHGDSGGTGYPTLTLVTPQGGSDVQFFAPGTMPYPVDHVVATIDGRPVSVSDNGVGWFLTVQDYHGLDVSVELLPYGTPYASQQGMLDLLRSITVVADPTDHSTWTADVLR